MLNKSIICCIYIEVTIHTTLYSLEVEFISLASEKLNYYYCFSVAQRSPLFIFKYELGNDSLFFGITFHLCGQVEILKLDFKRLRNENERTKERFSVLTKRHVYLLNLAKMLDDTISSILAVQLFTSCVLICTSGKHSYII